MKPKARQAEACPTLSAAGMHFEVWIQAKLLDANKYSALSCRGAYLRAAVRTRAPYGRNARGKFLRRSACAQHLAEVDPGLCVEAQVPDSIRGQPAAVAALAEWRGGRSDDAEDRAVRKPEAFSGRGRIFVSGEIAP